MSGAHAFCAPSAASRWKVCALSPSLEAAYPSPESEESMEGTAAHWVVEMVASGVPPVMDQQAPNGVAVTREMLEGAQLVIDTFVRHLGPDWRSMVFIEKRIYIKRIHAEHCWGTPDYYAWARLPDGRFILFLFDYKFGHEVVEVAENDQLVSYTAGLLDEVGLQIDDAQIVVQMIIIQPRSNHRDGSVRGWRVLASDLRGQINILSGAAHRAVQPDALATPDPDVCKNCSGRHVCTAAQRSAYGGAARGQRAVAHELTPEALGLELHYMERAQDMLKARVSGLRAQAEALLNQGQRVPFYAMQPGKSNLAWKHPPQTIIGLGMMSGKDLRKPDEVITPTQARDRKLVSEDMLKLYAHRPPAALKLTHDDGTQARLTFAYTPV